jgi:hypothetical protein
MAAYRNSGLSRRNARRRQHRLKPRFVPRLEILEDRTLPSTLTVLNNLDSGAGSLRDTISAAGSGDTIVFASSLKNKTITLTTGELAVGKNLDIEGLGAKKLTISGNAASRVFHISGGATVTIAGLSITNGLASGLVTTVGGGGIWNDSSVLNLSNDVLSNNVAFGVGLAAVVSDFDGGAVLTTTGALNVTDCTFLGNRTIGDSGGGSAIGGAMFSVFSTSTVTNSTFLGNQAIGGPGADAVTTFGFGAGGAIGDVLGTLTVHGSTFTDNQAAGGVLAAGAVPFQNAFIGTSVAGGGIFAFIDTLSVADSTFTGNQAIGGAGSAGGEGVVGSGGAITAFTDCVVTIANSAFSNNMARGGRGGSGAAGGAGLGGAIEAASDTTMTIANSILSRNRALGGAGGAGAAGGAGIGGGIEVGSGAFYGFPDASSLILSGSTLDDNRATGGDGRDGGSGGDGLGGALAVLAGTTTVCNSTLDHNRATGGDGDDGGNGGNGFGGGAYVASGATVGVTGSTISFNRAEGGKGDDGGSNGLGIGGGVYDLGMFTFDVFTVIAKNHASTSHDDLFP